MLDGESGQDLGHIVDACPERQPRHDPWDHLRLLRPRSFHCVTRQLPMLSCSFTKSSARARHTARSPVATTLTVRCPSSVLSPPTAAQWVPSRTLAEAGGRHPQRVAALAERRQGALDEDVLARSEEHRQALPAET